MGRSLLLQVFIDSVFCMAFLCHAKEDDIDPDIDPDLDAEPDAKAADGTPLVGNDMMIWSKAPDCVKGTGTFDESTSWVKGEIFEKKKARPKKSQDAFLYYCPIEGGDMCIYPDPVDKGTFRTIRKNVCETEGLEGQGLHTFKYEECKAVECPKDELQGDDLLIWSKAPDCVKCRDKFDEHHLDEQTSWVKGKIFEKKKALPKQETHASLYYCPVDGGDVCFYPDPLNQGMFRTIMKQLCENQGLQGQGLHYFAYGACKAVECPKEEL